MDVDRTVKLCKRSRKCSKEFNHRFGCDKKRAIELFWNDSPLQKRNVLEAECTLLEGEKTELGSTVVDSKRKLDEISAQKADSKRKLDEISAQKVALEEDVRSLTENKNDTKVELKVLSSKVQPHKLLFERHNQAKSQRQKHPTTLETISDVKNSTRYSRRQETKDVLEYIHGGDIEAALYGAWVF